MAIVKELGIRILWKYTSRDRLVVYYSWERWFNNKGYYERAFPPIELWINMTVIEG